MALDRTDVADVSSELSGPSSLVSTQVAGSQGTGGGPLARGDLVGRYVIMGQVGAGGMGVVFAAYDPELDRKVALKLLLTGEAASMIASDARARLVREAQALAQLSHPNVVAIHDVGALGQQVWIAMEFIEGLTLGAWLHARPRDWREVVAVFRAAAEGLGAAHAAGLVHRDFKPENVMIGADGRVRVMDFGIARSAQAPAQSLARSVTGSVNGSLTGSLTGSATGGAPGHLGSSLVGPRPAIAALQTDVTRAGAILGTPAYMAPEQWLDRGSDARTDQFAFCVALWEALYGGRPFAGGSIAELATAVTTGTRQPPPRAAGPGWLRRIVERGLAVLPGDRWPSMAALLAALDSGARKQRRRGLAVVGVVLAGLAGLTVGLQQWGQQRRIAGCIAAGADISAVWNDEARAATRAAMLATTTPFAATSAERVVGFVDRFAEQWQQTRTAACEHAEVARDWDADTDARAQACLLEARWSLEGLLAALAGADAATVERAALAAAGLPVVTACLDRSALSFRPQPPQDDAALAEAAQLRQELERAVSLRAAGRLADGLALAEGLVARADALEFPPLAARTRIVVGGLRSMMADPASARGWLVDGLVIAAAAGADELVADAASELTFVLGSRLARHEEALEWGRLGEALLTRQGQLETPRGARLLNNLANVHYGRGDFAAAQLGHERVLAIREATLGPMHPDVSGSLNNLGLVLLNRGDFAGAQQAQERALRIRGAAFGEDHPDLASSLNNLSSVRQALGDHAGAEQLLGEALRLAEGAFGPDHPTVCNILNNLANTVSAQGRLEEARRLHERVLATRERMLGPDHPSVGASLGNFATVLHALGELDAAQQMFTRALPIVERSLGPDHPDLAKLLNNFGNVEIARGDLDAGQRLAERALAIRERTVGPEHPDTAMSRNNLGDIQRLRKAYPEAIVLYDQAIAAWEKALGPDHPDLALALLGSGEALLALGRTGEALPRIERGRTLRAEAGPGARAEADHALARALWAAGEHARALELARLAATTYADAGPASRDAHAAVLAWIREHESKR